MISSAACAARLARRSRPPVPLSCFAGRSLKAKGPMVAAKTRWAWYAILTPSYARRPSRPGSIGFQRKHSALRLVTPYTHHLYRGDVDAEFIFLALNTTEDVKKLPSLELSGACIKREVPKAIIDACTMRVGRG